MYRYLHCIVYLHVMTNTDTIFILFQCYLLWSNSNFWYYCSSCYYNQVWHWPPRSLATRRLQGWIYSFLGWHCCWNKWNVIRVCTWYHFDPHAQLIRLCMKQHMHAIALVPHTSRNGPSSMYAWEGSPYGRSMIDHHPHITWSLPLSCIVNNSFADYA